MKLHLWQDRHLLVPKVDLNKFMDEKNRKKEIKGIQQDHDLVKKTRHDYTKKKAEEHKVAVDSDKKIPCGADALRVEYFEESTEYAGPEIVICQSSADERSSGFAFGGDSLFVSQKNVTEQSNLTTLSQCCLQQLNQEILNPLLMEGALITSNIHRIIKSVITSLPEDEKEEESGKGKGKGKDGEKNVKAVEGHILRDFKFFQPGTLANKNRRLPVLVLIDDVGHDGKTGREVSRKWLETSPQATLICPHCSSVNSVDGFKFQRVCSVGVFIFFEPKEGKKAEAKAHAAAVAEGNEGSKTKKRRMYNDDTSMDSEIFEPARICFHVNEMVPHRCRGEHKLNFDGIKVTKSSFGFKKLPSFPTDLVIGPAGKEVVRLCSEWNPSKFDQFPPGDSILYKKEKGKDGEDERFFIEYPNRHGFGAVIGRVEAWRMNMRNWFAIAVLSNAIEEFTTMEARNRFGFDIATMVRPHMFLAKQADLWAGMQKRVDNETILKIIESARAWKHQTLHVDIARTVTKDGKELEVHENPRLEDKLWPATFAYPVEDEMRIVFEDPRHTDDASKHKDHEEKTVVGELLAFTGTHGGFTYTGKEINTHLRKNLVFGSHEHFTDLSELLLSKSPQHHSGGLGAAWKAKEVVSVLDMKGEALLSVVRQHVDGKGNAPKTVLKKVEDVAEELKKLCLAERGAQEEKERRLQERKRKADDAEADASAESGGEKRKERAANREKKKVGMSS